MCFVSRYPVSLVSLLPPYDCYNLKVWLQGPSPPFPPPTYNLFISYFGISYLQFLGGLN